MAPAIAAWGRHGGHEATPAERLVARVDVVQETTGAPGEADPETIVLRQQRGLRRARQVDTVEAAVVGACDGELTTGQILAARGAAAGARSRPSWRPTTCRRCPSWCARASSPRPADRLSRAAEGPQRSQTFSASLPLPSSSSQRAHPDATRTRRSRRPWYSASVTARWNALPAARRSPAWARQPARRCIVVTASSHASRAAKSRVEPLDLATAPAGSPPRSSVLPRLSRR